MQRERSVARNEHFCEGFLVVWLVGMFVHSNSIKAGSWNENVPNVEASILIYMIRAI